MKRTHLLRIGTAMLAASTFVLAQDAPPQDAPPPPDAQAQNAPPQNSAPQNQPPDQSGWRRLGAQTSGQSTPPPGQYAPGGQPNYAPPPPPPPVPATLTIAPGTYFSIRVNQPLSSDHSKVGDVFTASLAKPIVVNGVVVADRGQTVAGRVSEVDKGGLLKGSTKLGIELTDITLADGTQVPVHSALVSLSGPGSGPRNAAVIGSTTVVGAAVGGAAGFGTGAAIGAGAGAAAGIIGVLAAKGVPTIIRPEALLTFRMDQPIVVATDRAPQAFRYAGPGDYQQPVSQPGFARRPVPYYGAGYVGGYPYYPYYPYYGYYGYPYYGPGFGVVIGGRWR